jgi:hypothetical protein
VSASSVCLPPAWVRLTRIWIISHTHKFSDFMVRVEELTLLSPSSTSVFLSPFSNFKRSKHQTFIFSNVQAGRAPST